MKMDQEVKMEQEKQDELEVVLVSDNFKISSESLSEFSTGEVSSVEEETSGSYGASDLSEEFLATVGEIEQLDQRKKEIKNEIEILEKEAEAIKNRLEELKKKLMKVSRTSEEEEMSSDEEENQEEIKKEQEEFKEEGGEEIKKEEETEKAAGDYEVEPDKQEITVEDLDKATKTEDWKKDEDEAEKKLKKTTRSKKKNFQGLLRLIFCFCK